MEIGSKVVQLPEMLYPEKDRNNSNMSSILKSPESQKTFADMNFLNKSAAKRYRIYLRCRIPCLFPTLFEIRLNPGNQRKITLTDNCTIKSEFSIRECNQYRKEM